VRHIPRLPLPPGAQTLLRARQAQVDAGVDVDQVWRAASRAKGFQPVRETLKRMAGERERCMYCEDSHGMDIEHFWPKRGNPGYPEKAFVWSNLLLACAECNRAKGTCFPLDEEGRPLLLDPTEDWPIEHLTFVPKTCEFAAAFDERGEESVKGTKTLEVLPTLNYESVTNGRRRTYRRLREAAEGFLAGRTSRGELLGKLAENGDYGLAQWFFLGGGQVDQPFAALKDSNPSVWAEAEEVARTAS